MIFSRVMAVAACIAAVMAAAACAVVALCFTAYTLLLMVVPPAGAGAIVFALAAVIAAIAGVIAYANIRLPKSPRPSRGAPPPTLTERAVAFASDHPMATLGAAVVTGVAAFANPAIVTAVLRAFTTPSRNRR